MMLIKHKCVALSGLNLERQQTAALCDDNILDYCQLFNSVSTLVFDIAPYIKYHSESNSDADSRLFAMMEEEIAKYEGDNVRKARIKLNIAKLGRMLGRSTGRAAAESTLVQYLEFRKLDGKPEKGERKIADDFVLLFDEIMQDEADAEARDDGHISEVDLFRIGVLEFALQQSPYNFDI